MFASRQGTNSITPSAGVWLVSTSPNTHFWPRSGRPQCFCKIIQISTSDYVFLHFSASCTFAYLRIMFEQGFIYLDNHTRATQHHMGIPVEQCPATNVSEVLICLDARHFSQFLLPLQQRLLGIPYTTSASRPITAAEKAWTSQKCSRLLDSSTSCKSDLGTATCHGYQLLVTNCDILLF